jgi:uncharacterized protein (UPF0218 family)
MVKISYDAKIKSRSLTDFGGVENEFFEKVEEVMKRDEDIVVSIKGEEKSGMSQVAIAIPLTAFEKYYGCKPEQIVLTKEEEKRWQTKFRE